MIEHVAANSWEDAAPGNVDGLASALTTFGALPRRKLWLQRLKFVIRRLLGPPAKLERLSFIHFARTALLTEDVTGKRYEPPYVYFESHFNGSFDAYIDAFAYVVPEHLSRIWDDAYGFHGPQPAEQFKTYIREHDYAAAHFYSAYPQATATDIVLALALVERMRGVKSAPAAKFPKRFYAALPQPEPPAALPASAGHAWQFLRFKLRRRDPNYAVGGNAYGLTTLVPIADGHDAPLAAALAAIAEPFANLPQTHFGRLVVIDAFPSHDAPATGRVPGPHLLLSCVIDGDPEAYLRTLEHEQGELVAAITEHCESPKKHGSDFVSWMLAHRLQTTTFFAPYPDASVQEVRDALKLAARLRDLAGTANEDTETALRTGFVRQMGAAR